MKYLWNAQCRRETDAEDVIGGKGFRDLVMENNILFIFMLRDVIDKEGLIYKVVR